MAFETKPGAGALFKNKDKSGDRHPDYRGNVVDPDGRAWDLAAWLKEDRNGHKFMSLKISEPYRAGRRDEAPAQAPSGGDSFEDEIPFSMEWR